MEEPVQWLSGVWLRSWTALCVQKLSSTRLDGCSTCVCTCVSVGVYVCMHTSSSFILSHLPVSCSNRIHFISPFGLLQRFHCPGHLFSLTFIMFCWPYNVVCIYMVCWTVLSSFQAFIVSSELDCLFLEGMSSLLLYFPMASARSWAQLHKCRVNASWIWGSRKDW